MASSVSRTLQAFPTVSQGMKSHTMSSSGTPFSISTRAMRVLSNKMCPSSASRGCAAFMDPALVQTTRASSPFTRVESAYASAAAFILCRVHGGTPWSSGAPGPPPGTTITRRTVTEKLCKPTRYPCMSVIEFAAHTLCSSCCTAALSGLETTDVTDADRSSFCRMNGMQPHRFDHPKDDRPHSRHHNAATTSLQYGHSAAPIMHPPSKRNHRTR